MEELRYLLFSLITQKFRFYTPLFSWLRFAHTWGRGMRRCFHSSRRRGRRGPPCPARVRPTPPASCPPTWPAASTCPDSHGWWTHSELSLSVTQGRKEMVYLTMHSTHFIYGYVVKNNSDSKRGNHLPLHRLLFPISSKELAAWD